MKFSSIRNLFASPNVNWVVIVVPGAALTVAGLRFGADYQPQEVSWIWVAGASFAGLSALLDLACPFVFRAQVQFENERAAENFPDVPIVFEEARLVPGFLSEVISRHRDAGSLP